MTALNYFFGLAQVLLVVGALGYAAVHLRRQLLPGWDEAVGYLVAAVFGIGLLVILSEALGVFGLMRGWALVLSSVLTALAARYFTRMRSGSEASRSAGLSGPPAPPVAASGFWMALVVTGAVVAQWAAFTSYGLDAGISNFDSVWYHLPFSAEIFQTGSTLGFYKPETVFLNWFYPQNSELVHAVGMALTGSDFLSVLLNMCWLGLTLFAAWCIGRPYARPHLTLLAVAILLTTHTLVVREPGTAKNDIVAVALILSAMAIMINRSADASDTRGRVGPGWAMAAGGLAVGLAAGTKVTALAPAAMITLAVLFAAHRGTRLRSAGVWFGAAFLGGGFWYLRNLVATGNPIPQIQSIGPVNLPGPDRLQEGRPDFNVFHYIGDLEIWRQYFLPGLEQGFGMLWPLVIAVAVIGLVLVIWKPSPGRLIRTQAFAALFAIAAYFFTPLSAAGPEGSPEAFSINLRFLVPALAMALVLVPLIRWFEKPRAQLGLGFIFLILFFATGWEDGLLTEPGRTFGIAFALALVIAPALIWYFREKLSALSPEKPLLTWVLVVAVAAGLLLSWPLATGYLDSRYDDFEPETGLAEPYRWANGVKDAEIGLAGTTAGFRQFGFFGEDLSNQITYIGRQKSSEGFDVIRTCREFRQTINEAGLDYLVTSPYLNFNGDRESIFSPERNWVQSDPALTLEVGPGPVEVWRVDGSLDPNACDPLGPGTESTPGLADS
ncbi:MAG: hypothetical protein WD181_02055 [Solirubrobacterales bacterium]